MTGNVQWLHLPSPCPSPWPTSAHSPSRTQASQHIPLANTSEFSHLGRDTNNMTEGQVAFSLHTCWSATKAPRTQSLRRNYVMGFTYQEDRFNSASKKASWPLWGFSCSFFIYLFLATSDPSCSIELFSFGMWDIVARQKIEPWHPALEAQSLSR